MSGIWSTNQNVDPDVESRGVSKLLRLFDLEEVDRDTFRATSSPGASRTYLFGGQVAGQAVRAASFTVPADRAVHSLHGYFLRAGRADRPTVFHVDCDRDGRSFSARHVVVRQEGDVIMRLLVSFHLGEHGPIFEERSIVGAVPGPEAVPAPGPRSPHGSIFDLRLLGVGPPNGRYPGHPHCFWARARGPLPDDRDLHACVLTYLSDVGTGLAKLPAQEPPWTGPSLDHSVWIHRAARLDDWVLVELVPRAARGARGLYTGTVCDRQGTLIATIAQEHVMREQPSPG